MRKLKIFLIAGEVSGDRLGGALMASLKKKAANKGLSLKFFGIGGDKMVSQGLQLTSPMKNVGLIGIFEILPHIFKLLSTIKSTAKYIDELQPDLVVTIDSWDFCSRVVDRIKSRTNMKLAHYVSPTIWAYRKDRIHKLERLYDLVLSIFPFEAKYYDGSSIAYIYVGHPLLEVFSSSPLITLNPFRLPPECGDPGLSSRMRGTSIKTISLEEVNCTPSGDYLSLDPQLSEEDGVGKVLLGVMAGSRDGEVNKLLPIFIEAVNKLLDQVDRERFLIVFPAVNEAIANKIAGFQSQMNFKHLIVDTSKLQETDRINLLKSFDLALVKSGTSSLELTLAGVPMVVAYKINYFSELIARHIFGLDKNIKYVSMTNIMLGEEVIEEFLQTNCSSEKISTGLLRLLDPNYRKKLLLKYARVVKMLSNSKHKTPSDIAAEKLLELINL